MFTLALPRLFIFSSSRADGNDAGGRRGQGRAADAVPTDAERVAPEAADPAESARSRARRTPPLIGGRTQAEALARIRAGDVDAFEALYRTYYPRLAKLASLLLRSSDATEELLHDLFLQLWERRESLDVREDLGVYLQTAVRNRVYKASRHDGVVRRLEASVAHAGPDVPAMGHVAGPEAALDAAELARAFEAALAAVSERERQIIGMRWDEGMTFDEIARVLGVSKTRVRFIVARVQDKVRPFFEGLVDRDVRGV